MVLTFLAGLIIDLAVLTGGANLFSSDFIDRIVVFGIDIT